MTTRLPLAALALAATVACGGKEAELMRQRGRVCAGLVAAGTTHTMNDAELGFETPPLPYPYLECPSAAALPANSTCDASGTNCRFFFLFIPNDSGLCGSGIGQGCGYFCEVWTSGADGSLFVNTGDNSVPICASAWHTKARGCIGSICF
ncbi:MAG TPA: hypothetical protein VLU43_09470 [Anaeromyxobacteraceae bacterium]|nr:hypothetical protein [Anaeromyxobacteraceae bacterium]